MLDERQLAKALSVGCMHETFLEAIENPEVIPTAVERRTDGEYQIKEVAYYEQLPYSEAPGVALVTANGDVFEVGVIKVVTRPA